LPPPSPYTTTSAASSSTSAFVSPSCAAAKDHADAFHEQTTMTPAVEHGSVRDAPGNLIRSQELALSDAAILETAPVEIAEDVKAETEWVRTRWKDVIAEFDYDIRRIWLDSSPEDRAVFTLSHPDPVEHSRRITAYEGPVCGG
jgi:hypothetical protein